jgi:hypothetical protein
MDTFSKYCMPTLKAAMCLIFISTCTTYTMEDPLADFDPIIDDTMLQNRAVPTGTAIAQLNNLSAHELFSENMYKRTNPINQRSVLDKPFVRFATSWKDDCINWSADAFFTSTERVNYTKDSDKLGDYVNFDGDNIIGFIESISGFATKIIGNVDKDEIVEILPFFANMFHNERRFGILGQINIPWKDWNIQLETPFYYIQRNANMSIKDQEALQKTAFIRALPPADPNVAIEYIMQHASTDHFGIGDTRLKLLYNIAKTDVYDALLGAQFTIPTASKFESGIFLGNQHKNSLTSVHQLSDVIELLFQYLSNNPTAPARMTTLSTELTTDIIEKLSSIVANPSMGNDKHVGVGPYLELERNFGDHFTLQAKAALQYYFGAHEKRFYVTKRDAADFATPFVESQYPDFVDLTSHEWFFPYMYQTWVKPGMTTHFATQLNVDLNKWHTHAGYDFWWQGQESIDSVSAPGDINDRLDKIIAIKPRAIEHTLFGRIEYDYHGYDKIWKWSAFGSKSVINHGINSGFQIALALESSF